MIRKCQELKKTEENHRSLFNRLTVEWNIVHGDLIFHGFQVSNNICHTECLANFAFEILSNVVRIMNGPRAWDKHMDCDKAACSRLAGTKGMEFHTFLRYLTMTFSIISWSGAESEASMRPSTERQNNCMPVQIMLTATSNAMIGSMMYQPVTATIAMPINTPTEVQTSVIKSTASASSVMEFCFVPTCNRVRETMKLITEATAETASPIPNPSSGRG